MACSALLGFTFIYGLRAGIAEFGGSPRTSPQESTRYDAPSTTTTELARCSGGSCGAEVLRVGPRRRRRPPPPSPAPPPGDGLAGHAGHEWVGGATGFAERPGASERAASDSAQPHNATLLLIGVLSGSKNFDPRFWVRRALWAQRPWLYGVGWRFVVSTKVPKGDNDRISLYYEASKYGDMELVRGSELPPMQAYTSLLWWVLAASRYASRPDAPAFFGLTSDAVLLLVPRLSIRLEALLQTPQQQHTPADRRFIYGGDLQWAVWADGSRLPWSCIAATCKHLQPSRLAGDVSPLRDGLAPAARSRVEALVAEATGRPNGPCAAGVSSAFAAPSAELQLISSPLLLRVAGRLDLRGQRLEVTPPPQLWSRAAKPQSAAGRTPAQPATLAAIAFARAVHNASGQLSVTLLRLRGSGNVPPLTWEHGGKVLLALRGALAGPPCAPTRSALCPFIQASAPCPYKPARRAHTSQRAVPIHTSQRAVPIHTSQRPLPRSTAPVDVYTRPPCALAPQAPTVHTRSPCALAPLRCPTGGSCWSVGSTTRSRRRRLCGGWSGKSRQGIAQYIARGRAALSGATQ